MKKHWSLTVLTLSLVAGTAWADIPSEPTTMPEASPTPTPEPAGGCDVAGCVIGQTEGTERGMAALLLGVGLVGASLLMRRKTR